MGGSPTPPIGKEMELNIPFQATDDKTSLTKCFSFTPRSSELIFKTGSGIIQT